MDSLPNIRIAVVATTPLEALTDRIDGLISLDMTWGPMHESSVYIWHGAQSNEVQSLTKQRPHPQSTGVSEA